MYFSYNYLKTKYFTSVTQSEVDDALELCSTQEVVTVGVKDIKGSSDKFLAVVKAIVPGVDEDVLFDFKPGG